MRARSQVNTDRSGAIRIRKPTLRSGDRHSRAYIRVIHRADRMLCVLLLFFLSCATDILVDAIRARLSDFAWQ
ncbi:hypothetical protein G7K_4585-t1 [Saitoella complicata NRRL Y-17804]|uniref:Uncharacterized protein n=1 Tax=Saitoella complicata (strain BCRC 22490 / CBS 7301 / JCM 7358 / NBRC 10748 / NRRL Y-17804) TaxID=698492 RepID=A0A0E9NLB3_SAICN|nr:hypothetical protein G7K_4585-t1 [Saitoella complicata NRRL Y-17804]